MNRELLLFSGTNSGTLAAHVAQLLHVEPGRCTVERFPDGETSVHLDEPVRGREVYLVHGTCPPVNDSLIELLSLADASRRSSAASITAVVPYFGYARSDKRGARRSPIGASMVAAMMQAVGINHLVTVDLHAAQIEGFFQIPVENLTAVPSLAFRLAPFLPEETVIVSPDEGRFKMATAYAQMLGKPVVGLHKTRDASNAPAVTKVIGDVKGRPCLIIDDMISTGRTIRVAVEALLAAGALPKFYVAATHGVFVDGATASLRHPAIRTIFVSDSVSAPAPSESEVVTVSIAPLLAETIQRLRADQSLAELYERPTAEAARETLVLA